MSISLACLGLSIWLLLREQPLLRSRWRGLLVLTLAFPPVYFGLIDGENAVLSLLLYVLIFRALNNRKDSALGVWAALGLFKPQLFIVFPILFVATRRWRALAAYVVVALVLLGASVLLVGVGGLEAWGRILLEPEASNSTANGWRMASLKAFLDSLFAGPRASLLPLGLYVVGAGVALAALVRAWLQQRAELPILWAFTCLVAVLVDPHLVDYDLTVLVCAGAVGLSTEAPALWRWLTAAIYISALVRPQLPVADSTLLITPVLLVVLALVMAARVQPLAWSPAQRPQRQTALS
jgi:hypothetical protein